MLDLTRLPESELSEFIARQPWFRAHGREGAQARVLEATFVHTVEPLLAIALVEVATERGLNEIYQVPMGLRADAERRHLAAPIASLDGWTAYDALSDPDLAYELVDLVRTAAGAHTDEAAVDFEPTARPDVLPPLSSAQLRAIGEGHSNSSVVVGEELVLKAYRRLAPGINPELELLRFLGEHGFENTPALLGSYAHSGRQIDATLGIVSRFVPSECDGWTFALASLAGDPSRFLERLQRLGEVTGSMHVALASDSSDPAFAPEEPSAESLALVAATLDEEIETVFAHLPESEVLAPIAGLGEAVRDRLRVLSRISDRGRVTRLHGNFHLGDLLWTGGDWIVLDFEGPPDRSLAERRQKRSPLRDVASMLRSFAYAASATELTGGQRPPPDWEERARENFLRGYFSVVEPSGLAPGGAAGAAQLLEIFELEKAVDELRHELEVRPEWLPIPVAAIGRLLAEPLRE
ncbi:MAG TPA: phosphotransferase [Gaiellales bacterium]|jgi:trehalose synthase-fused probable maltokinase|nr:phosphotransferase [Gaiellales bacterium]